jgi:hypothetical protein
MKSNNSKFLKRMSRIFDYFKTIEMITYETDIIILTSLKNQIEKRIETIQKEGEIK